MFGRLFGGRQSAEEPAFTLAHTRGFTQEVVGEASYQKAISKVVGGKTTYSAKHECTALLICDDANKYDQNAVEVQIDGRLVGYLPKNDAAAYRQELENIDAQLPSVAVRAKVVGGWRDEDSEGEFGVKLNLRWPLKKA